MARVYVYVPVSLPGKMFFWTQEAKVSQKSFALSEACLHQCNRIYRFAFVLEAFHSLGPKHLLHPLPTTFRSSQIAAPLPGTLVRNSSFKQSTPLVTTTPQDVAVEAMSICTDPSGQVEKGV